MAKVATPEARTDRRISSLFESNEADANRKISFSLLFTSIFVLIVWFLSIIPLNKGKPVIIFNGNIQTVVNIAFPITLVLLLIPMFLINTDLLKNKKYKYFLISLFGLVIAVFNIFLPKHCLLGWAAWIIMTGHFYAPKLARNIFFITAILLLVTMYCSLFVGEWENNYFGCNDLILDQLHIEDSIESRRFVLDFLKDQGDNRYVKLLTYYYFPRLCFTFIISFTCYTLSKRTSDLFIASVNRVSKSEKIDAELTVGKEIQSNACPREYPETPFYDLYGYMVAAKEVGGDFYDFYKVGSDRFVFVIADVSGKGVPAALFMMKAKTLIKSLAMQRLSTDRILEFANKELCEGNEAEMFMTCWLGILDINSGSLFYSNAGHNPIFIRKANGSFKTLNCSSDFVMAGFNDTKYTVNEEQLDRGDELFLYTDGVTEAMNTSGELYSTYRLENFLNALPDNISRKDVCDKVLRDVRSFAGSAEQSDDITLISFKYKGHEERKIFAATIDNVVVLTNYVDAKLEEKNIGMKIQAQIDIAIDEIFSNIVKYGYENKGGDVEIVLHFDDEERFFTLSFKDYGIPYNPLEQAKSASTTGGVEKRQIGGLGLIIVRSTMDEVTYQYQNANILTLKKKY